MRRQLFAVFPDNFALCTQAHCQSRLTSSAVLSHCKRQLKECAARVSSVCLLRFLGNTSESGSVPPTLDSLTRLKRLGAGEKPRKHLSKLAQLVALGMTRLSGSASLRLPNLEFFNIRGTELVSCLGDCTSLLLIGSVLP